MSSRILLAAIAVAALCAGCDSRTGDQAAPNQDEGAPAGELVGSQWRLASIEGRPVEPPSGSGMAPTLSLDAGGEVSGYGGCNRFSGTYRLEADGLSFGPIASTKMACPQIGDLEQRFFRSLAATAGHRLEDGELLLLDEQGGQLACLQPVSKAPGKY